MSDEAKKIPFKHHLVTELRKLLVPIVVAAISGGAAGGGIGVWKADETQRRAVEEAIREAREEAHALERLRTEIKVRLLKSASWDEVGRTMKVDEARIVEEMAVRKPAMDREMVSGMIDGEIRQMTAQRAFAPPPQSPPREE